MIKDILIIFIILLVLLTIISALGGSIRFEKFDQTEELISSLASDTYTSAVNGSPQEVLTSTPQVIQESKKEEVPNQPAFYSPSYIEPFDASPTYLAV